MKNLFLYRFRSDVEPARETLVVFVASQKFDSEEFDALVQDELDENLWPDEILVVVRETAFEAVLSQMRSSPRIQSLINRFPRGLPVMLSGFGAYGQEERRSTVFGFEPTWHTPYKDFTNRAITSIFRSRGALVEANDAFHFENPSKRHTHRFMRVSNMLVHGAEVSFVAFALLPKIPPSAQAAYVDTPSLFGLIGAINEHWSELGLKRRLAVDSFGSYAGLKEYKFTQSDECVVLISASSSGSLADKVVETEPLISTDRIVHCVFLGTRSSRYIVACDLSLSQKNPDGFDVDQVDYHAGHCQLCNSGSIPIPLVGDQFDIAGPQPGSVLISVTDAPKGLGQIMDRLVGKKVLRVGLGRPRENVPRQFDVSASDLLSSKEFLARANYVRSRSVPAQLAATIILDDLSRPFASFLTPNAKIVDREELRVMETVYDPEPVLIAAVAVESGRSLLDVSRDLRSAYPNSPQVYVVGFAKTTSEEALKRLKSTLVQTAEPQQHEFAAVETMILPASKGSTCWSRELELLDRLLNGAVDIGAIEETVLSKIKQRRDVLAGRNNPLIDNLFWENEGIPLKLQHGFVFWPLNLPQRSPSQADVYFTISSVLQNLRSVTKPGAKALRAGRLQHTLLDPHNFGRFNDGIIQASLLRAAMPSELNYAADMNSSSEMARIARRIFESCDRPRGEGAAEILMAIAIGQLNLREDDLGELLRDLPKAPPTVSELLRICRAVKGIV